MAPAVLCHHATAAPVSHGEINPTAYEVALIDEHHVATAGGGEGFLIADVSTPLDPRFVSSVDQFCGAVAVSGSVGYLGGGAGLSIIDLSTLTSPVVLRTIPLAQITRLRTYGDLLFVSRYLNGWIVMDVSNSSNPRAIGELAIPEGACAPRGSLVYHASGDGLRVIDISNPGEPTIISRLFAGGGADIALDSTLAYVGRFDGLTIVDISQADAPFVVGGLTIPKWGVRYMDLLMPYVYLSVYSYGIYVIDVSDPKSPSLVGDIDLPREASLGVEFAPPYAYVAGGQSFQVLDITDPAAPILVGYIETAVELSRFMATPQSDGILIEWSTAFESQHLGFRLLRRSPGEEYRLLTPNLIPPPGPYEFLDRDVIPDVVYEYALEAIDRTGEIQRFGPISARASRAASLRVESWPNPFSAADLPIQIHADVPAPNMLTLNVFDASGRLIRNLWEGRLADGSRTFEWDGRDARGLVVPSGVYFYRLVSPERSAQASIVFLR